MRTAFQEKTIIGLLLPGPRLLSLFVALETLQQNEIKLPTN